MCFGFVSGGPDTLEATDLRGSNLFIVDRQNLNGFLILQLVFVDSYDSFGPVVNDGLALGRTLFNLELWPP